MSHTTLSLPPIAVLSAAAATLAETARQAGNLPLMRAINKAMLQLHEGTAPIETAGGWLLESRTRPGIVHRISAAYGCSCEAGVNGKVCWHAKLLDIITEANSHYTMPALLHRTSALMAASEVYA